MHLRSGRCFGTRDSQHKPCIGVLLGGMQWTWGLQIRIRDESQASKSHIRVEIHQRTLKQPSLPKYPFFHLIWSLELVVPAANRIPFKWHHLMTSSFQGGRNLVCASQRSWIKRIGTDDSDNTENMFADEWKKSNCLKLTEMTWKFWLLGKKNFFWKIWTAAVYKLTIESDIRHTLLMRNRKRIIGMTSTKAPAVEPARDVMGASGCVKEGNGMPRQTSEKDHF